MKPNQQAIDRSAFILREARDLARQGEPIMLSPEDVRALIATSVVAVRNAARRKVQAAPARSVSVQPISLEDMNAEFAAEVAAVRRGRRSNHAGSRRRNRAGSPKRSFDVFDADSSSGTLVPIGHPLALVRVGEALESRDFARALVTAKLVPARSKIIDGDGDGEVFGLTVRLPSGEVRQFFLQLAAEDLRGLARDYVEGQIESGASTKSSLIANPLSGWEPDDVRDATGLSEGASSAEFQKAKAALASAIRAAARRRP